MEQFTLVSLLDEDREMVMANLAHDRALPAAQAVLEKAVDLKDPPLLIMATGAEMFLCLRAVSMESRNSAKTGTSLPFSNALVPRRIEFKISDSS